MAESQKGEFSFSPSNLARGRNALTKIQTAKKKDDDFCYDDCVPPVKAQTMDELLSLQRKRSAPTTPIKSPRATFSATITDEERQIQQLQSISASLASVTRETGPKVVRGDPARDSETPRAAVTPRHHTPAVFEFAQPLPESSVPEQISRFQD